MKDAFKTAGSSPPASTTGGSRRFFSRISFSHRLMRLIAVAKHAACTSIFLPSISGADGVTCITSRRDFCIQHRGLEVCFGGATAGGAR